MSRPLARGAALAPGFEVIEHLRRGRHLDVYDAWSEERSCRCVVKALRPDRAGEPGPRRRLLQEGRLLCRLTHPHIVRGYEVIEEPGPLVVMETLGGETLAHLIATRPEDLTVPELAHLGLHLATAVRYLHRHGYLHLDLKPSNVIAEAGRARLIDLSVARPPGAAHPGIGTWCYLAPEQARGEHLGPAADVWGVGVVLFEAATGEPAFEDGEAVSASTADPCVDGSYGPRSDQDDDDYPQLRGRAPRMEVLRPVPAALGDLVAACLEPRPDERPSVQELLAGLEALADLPASELRFSAPAAGVGARDRDRQPL